MKKILFLIMMIVFINAQAKDLIFATEATYPPFESVNNKGEIIGFDVDVMNALCSQLKVRCKIVNAPFDSLIPGLMMGKYDAVIASMSITEKRKEIVDFTLPYYSVSVSLVAPIDSNINFSDVELNKVSVGVQGDSAFTQFLREQYGNNINIKNYKSEQSAFFDLSSGRVNAVMGDSLVIQDWLGKDSHSNDYKIIKTFSGSAYFGSGTGIAVKKGNKELLSKLNAGLIQLKSSKSYQAIMQKWTGE